MKRMFEVMLVLVGLGCLTAVWGVPLPPMEPVTIEGSVAEADWHPSRYLEGKPGFSGSLGKDRTEPAHFVVKLDDYRGVNTATAWRLVRTLGVVPAKGASEKQPPKYLVVRLDHKDSKALKKGIRIRIVGYRISGDEGGTWTHYEELWILSSTGGTSPQP
ncbi:MAG: hypothetical protein ACYC6Y_22165 [Thermoguttaceae bacterium]